MADVFGWLFGAGLVFALAVAVGLAVIAPLAVHLFKK